MEDHKYVGVEIEFTGVPLHTISNEVRSTKLGPITRVMEDGSVRDRVTSYEGAIFYDEGDRRANTVLGGEICTPIMDIDNPSSRILLNQLCAILEGNGAVPTERASIHVHVNYLGAKTGDIRALIRQFLNYESVLYRLSCGYAGNHRGVINDYQYTRPLSSPIMVHTPEGSAAAIHQAVFNCNSFSEMLFNWTRIDMIVRDAPHYHPGRLHGLNLVPFLRQGSMEFRLFNSTMDGDLVWAWATLCSRLARYADNNWDERNPSPLGDRKKGFEPNAWFALLGIPEEAHAILMDVWANTPWLPEPGRAGFEHYGRTIDFRRAIVPYSDAESQTMEYVPKRIINKEAISRLFV